MSDAYQKSIEKIVKQYPPLHYGGCFVATRNLIGMHPELKAKHILVEIGKGRSPVSHAVAVTPRGLIIDTQYHQFGLLIPLKDPKKYVFTPQEHERLLPRAKGKQGWHGNSTGHRNAALKGQRR